MDCHILTICDNIWVAEHLAVASVVANLDKSRDTDDPREEGSYLFFREVEMRLSYTSGF
jgi:hypothetical protein